MQCRKTLHIKNFIVLRFLNATHFHQKENVFFIQKKQSESRVMKYTLEDTPHLKAKIIKICKTLDVTGNLKSEFNML